MRLFVSIDLEGIAGVATKDHLIPEGFDYEAARRWMTETLKAAIRGAESAGVAEFVAADSHGNGLNLLIDELPQNVEIIRAWPRPLGMAQGVDHGAFVGAVFLGYHAGASEAGGGEAHTLSGNILQLSLNGKLISESVLSAAICGHFGVPVLLITGDNVALDHARAALGDIETVITKHSHGFRSSRTLTPEKSYGTIQERTALAIARANDVKPYVIEGPIDVEIKLRNRVQAELMTYIPSVEAAGPRDIRIQAKDIVEVSKWLQFMTSTTDTYS